jgi:flagellar biosynthesis anti-sigma factor FlgM
MEIKRILTDNHQGPAEKTRETDHKALEQTKTDTARGASTSVASDRLQLSNQYQEISAVKRVTMGLSDIRSERVDTIRNMIENGTYVVKPDEIAKKMTEEIF